MDDFIPNPTEAKDIALYFADVTDSKITPAFMSRTTKSAKELLQKGYTKQQIMDVVLYSITKNPNIYSFGYIFACIDDVLYEQEQVTEQKRVKIMVEEAKLEHASTMMTQRGKVSEVDDSTARNKRKAERINLQSRLGAKLDFNMFEGK